MKKRTGLTKSKSTTRGKTKAKISRSTTTAKSRRSGLRSTAKKMK